MSTTVYVAQEMSSDGSDMIVGIFQTRSEAEKYLLDRFNELDYDEVCENFNEIGDHHWITEYVLGTQLQVVTKNEFE